MHQNSGFLAAFLGLSGAVFAQQSRAAFGEHPKFEIADVHVSPTARGFAQNFGGVLREGRKFWALARTGQSTTLKGRDKVDGYLLLATACESSGRQE